MAQTPGVVKVAVGQYQKIEIKQVQLQFAGIFQKDIGITNIKQNPALFCFNKIGDTGLSLKIPVNKCIIIYKYR